VTHAPPGGYLPRSCHPSPIAAPNVLAATPTSTEPIGSAAEGIKMFTLGAVVCDMAAKPAVTGPRERYGGHSEPL